MKALIVGSGSIGTRHLKNLKQLHPKASVALWRQHGRQPLADDIAPLVAFVFSSEAEAMAWRPDIALICNPAPRHVPVGLALAHAGAALFVEKPLADTPIAGCELVETCRAMKRTLFVAYNFPFNDALRRCHEIVQSQQLGRLHSIRAEVGQYLPDWRPGRDYREGVTAQAKLGGGALLELSHEIDHVLWTSGSARNVSARLKRLGDLEIDVEDTVEMTLELSSGALASIHLDLLRRDPFRQCTWVGSEGTLVWNGITNEVILQEPGVNNRRVIYSDPKPDRNAMYLAELEHFLTAVDHPQLCEESTQRAVHVLEVIEAARTSSQTGTVVFL